MAKMSVLVLIGLFFCTLFDTSSARSQSIQTAHVEFVRGSGGTEILGKIRGDQIIDYVLSAKAGSSMSVEMTVDNPSAHFIATAPGAQAALHAGSTSGNSFTTQIPSIGIDAIRMAQAQPDKDEARKKKQQAERRERRQDANQTRRQQTERRGQGPDRADQHRRRQLREQQQQRKALQEQRQRQKALKGEQYRRKTIEADTQRQQQLRQERERQRALQEERQRQRALKEQRQQQNIQRQQQKDERELRQQQRAQREQQQRERELLKRQQNEQRQRAQRERRENIVKQTDTHTVRTRKRIDRRGREQYATSRHYWVRDGRYRNRYRNGRSIYFLPPLGVNIARDRYYLYGSQATYDDYVDLFEAPPVMDIPRRYTMDEIVEDPEVRSMVRSVDIDMITFASGSAVIADEQLYKLDDLANAMLEVLQKDPYEKFLIEGHTDATGSDEANLLLSEERADAVQTVLIEEYGIPADNLEAVGYGEQYLLIETQGPERRNRRVTMRAVGNLLAKAQ